MTHHAKAASAGSTQAAGLSRSLFRRAFATRGASGDSSGSGAPATGLCLLLVFSVAALLGSASASAAPPLVAIGAPQNPSYTSVEVGGEVDPKGEFVEWFLEVSSDGGATWEWPGGFGAPGTFGSIDGTSVSGPQSIGTQTLGQLKPGTTYQVRLQSYNYSEFAPVYSAAPNPEFTTVALPDPTLTLDPITAFASTTAHFSGEIDPNAPVGNPEASDVRWHFECTPECPGIDADKTVKAEEGNKDVEVDATGLEPNTTYEVKLVGANASGRFETASQGFKTDAIAPSATTTPPLLLGGEVQLGGRVNPHNSAAKYWVEYGTTTAYGTTVPATEDGDAGSDGVFHTVSETVGGLEPGTTYHVRVVAESATGRTDGQDLSFELPSPPDPGQPCANAAIRAEQQVNLPACRAYELVSRGNGNFGNVLRVPAASDDGEKVTYTAKAADGSAASAFLMPVYVGARGSSGWTPLNANPIPPQDAGRQVPRLSQVVAVADDSSRVLISTFARLDSRDNDIEDKDLYLVDVPSGKATMISIGSLPDGSPGTFAQAVGASLDLGHIYFQFNNGALLPDLPSGAIYLWSEGQLSAHAIGAGAGLHSQSGFEGSPGTVFSRLAHNGPHVSSDDGSVFFGGSTRFSAVSGTNVNVAASQGASDLGSSTFIGASHDGDLLYFANPAQLTGDATPGGGIYRYINSSDELELVTPPAGPGGLGVSEAVMSDDGSRVYFIARAAVAPGAEPGASNLYVQDGAETRFILTVPDAQARIRRTSQDGRYVILGTTASLAGVETNGHQTLYELDDQLGVVACVSCRADGSPSQSDASLDDTQPAGIGDFPAISSPRNISDDGRVFFATEDRLVVEDQDTGSDVYEYFNGTVALLSSAEGGWGSYVADSSDDGRTAFIVTANSLLPEDHDGGLTDVYAARVGGGYPNPPAPPPACESNCQQRQGAPSASSIGSEALRDSSGKAKISVAGSRTARGATAALRVQVNAAGTIGLTGGRVQNRSHSVAKPSTYWLRVALNSRGRLLLKKGGVVKAPITIFFEPTDGRIAEKNLTLTFRPSGTGPKGDHR